MIVTSNNYLVKARISIGEFFDVPADDVFIELREPDTKTTFRLNTVFNGGDNEKIIDTFIETLPALTVSHNLMKTDTAAHTPEEVAAIIASKLDLFLFVLDQYKEKIIFTLGKKSNGR